MAAEKKPAPTSRFELVMLAGARARQLMRGATPRVDSADRSARAAKIAEREVRDGKVGKLADTAE